MKRWEYTYAFNDPTDDPVKEVNQLGCEGWEVVAYEPENNTHHGVFFLKRELVEGRTPMTPERMIRMIQESKDQLKDDGRLIGAAAPTPDAGEDGELLIIDAAVEVAVFSKTHEWPKEMSPDFFKFAQLLDDLATKIQARYPEFNKNVRAAKSNSPSAGAEGGNNA